jgi:hypothetical protein
MQHYGLFADNCVSYVPGAVYSLASTYAHTLALKSGEKRVVVLFISFRVTCSITCGVVKKPMGCTACTRNKPFDLILYVNFHASAGVEITHAQRMHIALKSQLIPRLLILMLLLAGEPPQTQVVQVSRPGNKIMFCLAMI